MHTSKHLAYVLVLYFFITSVKVEVSSKNINEIFSNIANSPMSVVPSTRNLTVTEELLDIPTIYYDMDGKPVPMLSNQVEVFPSLKQGVLRYGWLPCNCQSLTCGCCSNLNYLSVKRKDCLNFTYDPEEFSLGMQMLTNDKQVYQNSISGKNPPPACLPISPIPLIPVLEFCIRLYNIFTPGHNIHVCVNFETKLASVPLLVLQFDCFRLGADGFAFVKPNVENAGLSTSTTMLPIEEVDPLGGIQTEIYDEVIEENEKLLNTTLI